MHVELKKNPTNSGACLSLIMHVAVRSMQAKLVGLHFSSLDRCQIADYNGKSGHAPGTDSNKKGSKRVKKATDHAQRFIRQLDGCFMQQSAEQLRCMTTLQSQVNSSAVKCA